MHLLNCQRTCEATARTITGRLHISGITAEPPTCTRHPPSQILCSAIIAASPPPRTATMVAKPPEMETCTVGSCNLHRWIAFSSSWLWRTTKGLSSYWGTITGRLRHRKNNYHGGGTMVWEGVAVPWYGRGGGIIVRLSKLWNGQPCY